MKQRTRRRARRADRARRRRERRGRGAIADGARERVGADIGVGITGVAGPDGGTPDKPVGLVHLCVSRASDRIERKVRLPGSRADVRNRSVVLALHMIRELLLPRSP